MIESASGKIIIFDGDCLLCNSFVRLLINLDVKKKFYFISSTSEYFSNNLAHLNISEPDKTVFLLSDGELYSKSEAVLKILSGLPKPVKYFYYFRFIPEGMRDYIYDLIARYRKRIFGSKNYCVFMTVEERKRILE